MASRQGARSRRTPPTLVTTDDESCSDTTEIDRDAREFGLLYKQGGWRLGLLVARCVYVGDHGGTRDDESDPVRDDDLESDTLNASAQCALDSKTTVAVFASKSGISERNVYLYHKAWELAADDGRCLHSKDLQPGQEDLEDIEEDDDDLRGDWPSYMRRAREPKKSKNKASQQKSPPKNQQQKKRTVEPTAEETTLLDDEIHHGELIEILECATCLVERLAGIESLDQDVDLLDEIAVQGEELTKTAQSLRISKLEE